MTSLFFFKRMNFIIIRFINLFLYPSLYPCLSSNYLLHFLFRLQFYFNHFKFKTFLVRSIFKGVPYSSLVILFVSWSLTDFDLDITFKKVHRTTESQLKTHGKSLYIQNLYRYWFFFTPYTIRNGSLSNSRWQNCKMCLNLLKNG